MADLRLVALHGDGHGGSAGKMTGSAHLSKGIRSCIFSATGCRMIQRRGACLEMVGVCGGAG